MALGQRDGSLITGGVDLDKVDTVDGEKIVKNIFGDNEQAVVNQLGGLGGEGAGLIAKLLPLLAPMLMSYLGKSFGGAGGGGGGARPLPSSSGTSGMGRGAAPPKGNGGDGGGLSGLGDILCGLLGGGSGGGGGGCGYLGDILSGLGGLLGGGKR